MEEKIFDNNELSEVAGGGSIGARVEFTMAVILDGTQVDVEPCLYYENNRAGGLRISVALQNEVDKSQVRVCMPDGSEINYAGTIAENHITSGIQLTAYVTR